MGAGQGKSRLVECSLWDSQLPFIVQLLSTETLEEGCRGLCTLEGLPEARQNNVTVGVPYQHGGWITQYIVHMDQAFMQAEQRSPTSWLISTRGLVWFQRHSY